MTNHKRRTKGFTLLEMILVLAIMSSILLVLINYSTEKSNQTRREYIAMEMQQILNGALAFYVTNGRWPGENNGGTFTPCGCTSATNCSPQTWQAIDSNFELAPPSPNPNNQGYLPNVPTYGGNSYYYSCNNTTGLSNVTGAYSSFGLFQVKITLGSPADPQIIASMVPMGSYNTTAPNNYVMAQVNVPGQNLNNARSLNFAGVYYSGSCVPAPTCPLGMVPNIEVAPASAAGVAATTTSDVPNCSGNFDGNNDPSNCTSNVYPINTLIAFARGDNVTGAPTDPNGSNSYPNINKVSMAPEDCSVTQAASPLQCASSQTNADGGGGGLTSNGTMYWRVCLYVRTENGIAYPNATLINQAGSPNGTYDAWGKMVGTVLAFTRCVPQQEPIGSNDVWQDNNNSTP